jgi:hypothetical protein
MNKIYKLVCVFENVWEVNIIESEDLSLHEVFCIFENNDKIGYSYKQCSKYVCIELYFWKY